MLPEPSKGKKKPDIEDKDNAKKSDKVRVSAILCSSQPFSLECERELSGLLQRRNSLTDSSTFSSSTSSNSSSVDSDEAVNWLGTLRDSKGTMTIPTESIGAPEDTSPKSDDLDKGAFSAEKEQENTENAKPVVQTKKRAEKLRKEREKKDRKEREKAAAAKKEVENFESSRQSALFESEKERCMREMIRCSQRRGQNILGPVHYGSQTLLASAEYNPSETGRVAREEEKLRACVGFGIAATGVYDHLPKIAGARAPRPPFYSDLVGARKENWRESYQDSYLREHNHIGALYVEKDALESVARSMEIAWRRIQIVGDVLKAHRSHNNRFKTLGLTAMLEHIMESIVNLTRDRDHHTNVIMYLSSQFGSQPKPCFLEKHRQCLMLDLVLSCLSSTNAGDLLMEKTRDCQRQAIHFTAISGQPCQLDVLLKHGTPTNEFDRSKQAPIHYLVERNNVLMARQLMWYGSDMSLVEPSVSKVPSELFNVDNGERKLLLALRPDVIREVYSEGDSLVVFMLPVSFTPQDALMPAAYPHIVRTEMFEASYNPYKQAISLMKAPTLCITADQLLSKVHSTTPMFREVHNGYLYAWRIPCKGQQLKGVEFASLHYTLDTSKMDPQVARQAMLFVQMFVVKAPAARGKQKLE
ncbi:unnamed protein product [Heligmosomoides polygyrus]|uniref:ANK_REP_REGION domain-containing protein n=1 Tax=Heligmosomoides polygyrus TaxID=6339 RepID=A0A3P7Z6Z6_HELPZ|nr:unnamed protein product [Heligmosomoides polygyrus]